MLQDGQKHEEDVLGLECAASSAPDVAHSRHVAKHLQPKGVELMWGEVRELLDTFTAAGEVERV